jgi:hypothetical protein
VNEVIEMPRQNAAPVSVQDTLQTARTIQTVMQSVMKENTHYGVIPGCKQPSLYKAGSEALLSTFRIAVEPIVEEFISRDDRGRVREIRYRVKCVGRHIGTGHEVGFGVGECSTGEDKYAWRRAVCDEEYDAADEADRRIKWGKWQNKVQQTKQIRVPAADMSNTVLKMAKKRAQIDLTLTALGCSDIFAQDLEDLDEALREQFVDAAPATDPALTAKWVDQANAATDADKLKAIWTNGVREIKAAKDMTAYNAFKTAVEARGKTFKANAQAAQQASREPGADDDFSEEFARQIAAEQGAQQ